MKKVKLDDDAQMMAWAEAGAAIALRRIHAAFPRLRPAAPVTAEAPPPRRKKKRRLSKEVRERMSRLAKRRWAKKKRAERAMG